MTRFIFPFLLFVGSMVYSQDITSLNGKIIAPSLDGTAINILNLTQESGTTNLPSGEFEIAVRPGDTLLFSSLIFNDLEVKITAEILEKGYLEVTLTEKLNELNEVMISNINLSGNLRNDLSNIPTFNQADVGFPLKRTLSPLERKLHRIRSTALSSAYNFLSGKTKDLKEYEKIEKLQKVIKEGVQAVPKTFFTEHLEIPAEHIINFVYFCAENPNFYKLLESNRAFDLAAYYEKKAPVFLDERVP